jgi:hypothetical protein
MDMKNETCVDIVIVCMLVIRVIMKFGDRKYSRNLVFTTRNFVKFQEVFRNSAKFRGTQFRPPSNL